MASSSASLLVNNDFMYIWDDMKCLNTNGTELICVVYRDYDILSAHLVLFHWNSRKYGEVLTLSISNLCSKPLGLKIKRPCFISNATFQIKLKNDFLQIFVNVCFLSAFKTATFYYCHIWKANSSYSTFIELPYES